MQRASIKDTLRCALIKIHPVVRCGEGESSLTCTCCASSLVGVRMSTWEGGRNGRREEERREKGGGISKLF